MGMGWFGYTSVLMVSRLSPFFYSPACKKREMAIVRVVLKKIEQGCEGNPSRKLDSKWVEESLLT